MVLANVTPVCAWLRSLNRDGAPADGRPQLITTTIGTSVAIERSERRNMGAENLTLPVGAGIIQSMFEHSHQTALRLGVLALACFSLTHCSRPYRSEGERLAHVY